jgi:hypothetical protein
LTGQQKVNKRQQQQLQPQCIHPPEDSAVVVVGARKKKKKKKRGERGKGCWYVGRASWLLLHSRLSLTLPLQRVLFGHNKRRRKKKKEKKDCLARTRLALFLSAS